jgi:hypothetical protein
MGTSHEVKEDGLVVRARHPDPPREAYLYERRADGFV